MKNIPLLIAVALIAYFVGMAFACANDLMPMRTEPEKYGHSVGVAMLAILGGVGYFSYLGGRKDGES